VRSLIEVLENNKVVLEKYWNFILQRLCPNPVIFLFFTISVIVKS